MITPSYSRILSAINYSIRKWEKLSIAKGKDEGTNNCSLCKLFYSNHSDGFDKCKGCPVMVAGYGGCQPYYGQWMEHHKYYHGRSKFPYKSQEYCTTCHTLCQAMLDMLHEAKSLYIATINKEEVTK